MRIVVELGNPSYCRMKAIELIHEAEPWTPDSAEKVAKAISLLALSRVYGPIQA